MIHVVLKLLHQGFFNKLPSQLKNCVSINVFKNKLKAYLFSKPYDTDAQVTHSDYKIN